MSKRKAILHIGTMKTGTTSVQAAFKANPEWLAERGYAYLGWPMRRSEAISAKIAEKDPSLGIIISDEALWHFALTSKSDTRAIKNVLADFKVDVYAYLRRPDEFLESWYLQGLKSGTGARSFSQFMGSGFVKRGAQYRERLQLFSRLFGRSAIHVCPYERAQLHAGDIVLDFMVRTGLVPLGTTHAALAAQGFKQTSQQNMSPDAHVHLLMELVRSYSSAENKDILALFKKVPASAPLGGADKSRVIYREERDLITDAYRAELRDIQAEFGGGATEDFFVHWPNAETPHKVSPLRGGFDTLLGFEAWNGQEAPMEAAADEGDAEPAN
jgi:hypothetical protein